MKKRDLKTAARADFLPVMRALVHAYQAFVDYEVKGLREAGLTQPQADVIFALGNTAGLTFREIGEQTLITKGTLTGVIDRLEEKDLVRRIPNPHDRRCTVVQLTINGEQLFEEAFPRQVAYLAERFDRLGSRQQQQALRVLKELREIFL